MLTLKFILLMAVCGIGSAVQGAGMSNIGLALSSMCVFAYSIFPMVVLLMLVCAGLVYAGGQILGAETRSRANVWATAMLTGALIGVLIISLAPYVLSYMYGTEGYFDWQNCNFGE